MKKVLTVLAIMAIAMGMVFAKSNLSSSASKGSKLSFDGFADLNVKFTPTTDMTQFFDIGFSSNYITGLVDGSIPDVTAKSDITLDQEVSGGTGDYQNVENSVYLYYIVKGANVIISMQADGDLTYSGISDGNTISWKAKANDVEVSSSDEDATEVVKVDATSGIKAYSYPITISTVNLASKTLKANQEYSSTLKLTIAAAT